MAPRTASGTMRPSLLVGALLVACLLLPLYASANRTPDPFGRNDNFCNGVLLSNCQTCRCTSDEDDLPDLEHIARSINEECTIVALNTGTVCSDENKCTARDYCNGDGHCAPGLPITCPESFSDGSKINLFQDRRPVLRTVVTEFLPNSELSPGVVNTSPHTAEELQQPGTLSNECIVSLCDPDVGCSFEVVDDYTPCLPNDVPPANNPNSFNNGFGTECTPGVCIQGKCASVNRLPFFYGSFCQNNDFDEGDHYPYVPIPEKSEGCGRRVCRSGLCEFDYHGNALSYNDLGVTCFNPDNPCNLGICADPIGPTEEGKCQYDLDLHPQLCQEIPTQGLFIVEIDDELNYFRRHDTFEADKGIDDNNAQSRELYEEYELVNRYTKDCFVPTCRNESTPYGNSGFRCIWEFVETGTPCSPFEDDDTSDDRSVRQDDCFPFVCHLGRCGRPHRFPDFPANANECDDDETCTLDICTWSILGKRSNSDQDLADRHCFNEKRKEGAACDDGNPCTDYDQCAWGVCEPGSYRTCHLRAGDYFKYRDSEGRDHTGHYNGARYIASPPDPATTPNYELALASYISYYGFPGADDWSASCFNAFCDESDGECVFEFVEDGTQCGPGFGPGINASAAECSLFECSRGRCVVADDCQTGDDCTLGVCAFDGTCHNVVVAEECDDGLYCTGQSTVPPDQCLNGLCVGTQITCPSLPSDGAFFERIGDTVVTNLQLSGADSVFECEGYNLCGNFADACFDVACSEEDRGACVYTRRTDGTTCASNSGDLCSAYQCQTGACVPVAAVDCSALDDDCNTASCNSQTGACELAPRSEKDIVCDTGDLCSDGVCFYGDCVSTPRNCSSLDTECVVGVCDPSSGACTAASRNSGEECTTNDLCTEGICANGACAETARNCSVFDTDCTAGVCNSATGQCEAVYLDGDCDTGDLCLAGTCSLGICIGTQVDCSVLDDACATGVCQGATGACAKEASAQGTPCDSGDPCAPGICTDGACVPQPINCESLDSPCQEGVCVNGTCTLQDRSNVGDCFNGANPCTPGVCLGGTCTPTPVNCTSLNTQCTIGFCNVSTGLCESGAQPGLLCDDGNVTTVNDTCLASGACIGVVPVDTTISSQSDGGGTGGGDTTSSGGSSNLAAGLGGFAAAAVLAVLVGRRRRRPADNANDDDADDDANNT